MSAENKAENKNTEEMEQKTNMNSASAPDRDKVIVQTSLVGIAANILLVIFKAAVGIFSNSIAVILDAVNNLSDALSSVITIVGAKLAGRLPDKKHPLGYGRIEYLSAMIVSGIILYAGITSFVESIKKIIRPEAAHYTLTSFIIIGAAIVVKLLLGKYVRRKGEEVNSGALTASGADATFDAILSASVLLSALIYTFSGISLEAWVGAVIALVIVKAGIEMMMDTVDEILGQRPDLDVSRQIKKLLNEEPDVRGAYDLILNNYGPGKNYGSVHLELPDTMTVAEVDALTRRVESKVYHATGVILTGVGVYSYNTRDDEAAAIRNAVQEKVLSHDWALQLHGFYLDIQNKTMRFDVVMSFEANPKDALDILKREIGEAYPDYTVQITPDVDVSD